MPYCIFCMSPTDGTTVCPRCGKDQRVEIPTHHLYPGTLLLSRYLIGAALGEGGFGITYIGVDRKLGMRVAVKEYYPYGYATRNHTVSPAVSRVSGEEKQAVFDKGKQRFLLEARNLALFSGTPGVVDVRDLFELNGTAYIVMEYLEGQTLKAYLKRKGKLSGEETVKLFLPVMQALGQIHAKGLIHRDISPDNIMLCGDRIELIDFGAARQSSAKDNRTLSVILKPGFAPEEQYRSKGVQGPWTDIYALCATMYVCITGVTPDEGSERLANDRLSSPRALGLAVSPALDRVLMKGMSVRQQGRYQSVDELLADLKTVPEAAPRKKWTETPPDPGMTLRNGREPAPVPADLPKRIPPDSIDRIDNDDETTDDKITDDKTTNDKTTDDKEQKKKRGKDLFIGKRRWIALGFTALLSVLVVGIVGLVVSGNKASKRPASAPVDEGSPNRNIPANATAATTAPSNGKDATTAASATSALPSDNASILAKYKEVMDNTKKTVKTYDKLEWMVVKDLDVGSITGAVQGILNGVIKGEDAAELQDDRDDQGKQIPPVNTAGVGCGLTDASAIKSASCVDNGDGTATITITLNDEHNPEPMNESSGVSSSKVGGIFACMSQPDAVNTINGYADKIPGVSLQELELDYKGCTVVMTFDAAANHATKVEYTTPGYVSGSVKVILVNDNIVACLENHVRITDFKYGSQPIVLSTAPPPTETPAAKPASAEEAKRDRVLAHPSNIFRDSTVFGNDRFTRAEIVSVTFHDDLFAMPASGAWDVSETKNGTVFAWVDTTSAGKELHIAADGKVRGDVACEDLFYNYEGLTGIDFNGNFDTSQTTSMRRMFSFCQALQKLDVSTLDTSKVEDMSWMFEYCDSLTELDLRSFDTSRVVNMSCMFVCEKLEKLDLSSFDTSHVTDMSRMFVCGDLKTLDLSNFDTSNVTNISFMFSLCYDLEELDLSNFDTSKVEDMRWMFWNCKALKKLNVSSFDTSNVKNMEQMFYGCKALETLDLRSFSSRSLTEYDEMFTGTTGKILVDSNKFQIPISR